MIMMYEMTANNRNKARSKARESVRVTEMAKEENKWQKEIFYEIEDIVEKVRWG
jgi:hypothetical protein